MTLKTPRVWTDADDALLRDLIAAGGPAKLIAFKLKGSEAGVIARAKALGLPLAPTGPVHYAHLSEDAKRQPAQRRRRAKGE